MLAVEEGGLQRITRSMFEGGITGATPRNILLQRKPHQSEDAAVAIPVPGNMLKRKPEETEDADVPIPVPGVMLK